jgi:hypothetical protein
MIFVTGKGEGPSAMKTAQLLDADRMLERLIAVDGNAHAQERFYPLLTKSAGRKLNGMGVVNVIQLALYDYCQDLPAICGVLMQIQVPDLIVAIIDDDEVVNDAKQFFADIEASLKKTDEPKRLATTEPKP